MALVSAMFEAGHSAAIWSAMNDLLTTEGDRRRVRMELQRPTAGEAPRYLQLTLQPDLFGGWELLRESGQLGGRAQLRREQYLLQAEATAAFEKARDLQLKRGYQLMFVSGAEPPK